MVFPRGARWQALQMVGNNSEVDVEIQNFAGDGRPVLLGITERLEFVDAAGHADDLKRYRAWGDRMADNRIRLVTNRPMETVEVHPPSINAVNMTGVTVEYCPPRPAMAESGAGSILSFTLPVSARRRAGPDGVRPAHAPGREKRL